MTEPPRLDLRADLTVEVDGVPLRVTGTDAGLEVHTPDLAGVLAGTPAVGALRARAHAARAADALAAAGLRVSVHDGRGPVAEAGYGVDGGPLRRLVYGTAKIRELSPRVLAVLPGARERGLAAVGTAALVALVLTARRHNRAGRTEHPDGKRP